MDPPQRPPTPHLLALAAVLTACSSAPPPPHPDPVGLLDKVQGQLGTGNPGKSLETMHGIPLDSLPREMVPTFLVARAAAQLATGEPWLAFMTLHTFAEDHPLAEERHQVPPLLYSIGTAMVDRGRKVFLFADDVDDGRFVLEHLIVHYPGSPHHDEALRLLGDIAFAAEDFELADRRYREIVREWRDSEWVLYAHFRLAMTRFKKLRGPEYDLSDMEAARNELKDLLVRKLERPDFEGEAAMALDAVTRWIAERHLLIADYYRTVGNVPGELLHLQRAAGEEFAGTPSHAEARLRLKDGSPQ